MTRLWTDGAEFGDSLFFDGLATNYSVTTQARSGARSYGLTGLVNLTKTFSPELDEFYVRFGLYKSGIGDSIHFAVKRGSTVFGTVRMSSSGYLRLYSGSGGTTLQTETTGPVSALTASKWYLIEVHWVIGNSPDGLVEIKVDGIDYSTFVGIDTQPGAETTSDSLVFSGVNGSNTYFDDLACNDTSNVDGLGDNSWCNDGHVILLSPNVDGTPKQLDPYPTGTANHYTLIDNIPPLVTQYLQSAVSGSRDVFGCAASGFIDGDVNILRVWTEGRAKDTVAAGGLCTLSLISNGTEIETDPIALTTSYTREVGTQRKTNPDGNVEWTVAALDDVEIAFTVK